MKRVLGPILATLLLVGIVVGVPWLLTQWGRLVSLSSINWATVLRRPDDGSLTMTALTLTGWAAWACLTWTIIAEVVEQATQKRLRLRSPGTGWLRPIVALLVAAALSPVIASHAASPDASPPWTAPVQAPTAPAAVPLDDGTVPDTPEQEQPWREHTVRPGEELWDIAEARLGRGNAWREIVAANPGLDPDQELTAGTVLRLPKVIPVTPGDSLWQLADEHLDDPARWPELYEANRDLIADPDEIEIGWQLTLPGREIAKAADTQQAAPSTSSPKPKPPTPKTPEPSRTGRSAVPQPAEAGVPKHAASAPAGPGSSLAVRVLGPISVALAAGLFAALVARHRGWLSQRAVGQRLATTGPLATHWAALSVRADEPAPDLPAGLTPTTVLLGWSQDEEVWLDLAERPLWLSGDGQAGDGVRAGIWCSLLTANWSSTVEVVAVDPPEEWAKAVDDPRLTQLAGATGLEELDRLVLARRAALAGRPLAEALADSDVADDLPPTVFVFCRRLSVTDARRVQALLDGAPVAVSVVASVMAGRDLRGASVHLESQSVAVFDGRRITPQLLQAPARRAIVGLFAATSQAEDAPWWRTDLPGNITVLPTSPVPEDAKMPKEPTSPTLRLLGPVELVAYDGQVPTRCVGRCLEVCAWLLANPGATPTQMRESLLIAEGTRRSNVSRLRSWLGRGPDGEHLPDAYSGRIQLAPTVSSDWEKFQSLTSGGVNRTSDALLAESLALVRGAPLDGYEFQWGWAEQQRCDMLGTIVDAAAVLSERSVARGDFAMAEWALRQGMLAAPDSEVLAARHILLRSAQRDQAAVDREVLQLTRAARAAGRDLTDSTVRIIQKALADCRAVVP